MNQYDLPSHVSVNDLRAVLDAELPLLSSAPSDSARGFLESILVWVMQWAAANSSIDFEKYPPFAFLLDDGTSEYSGWAIWDFFKEEYPNNIGGRLIATSSALYSVRTIETNATSLSGLGEELSKLSLADNAMVVVDPSKGRMILALEGIRKPRIQLSLTSSPIIDVDEATVDNALSEFERDYTRYPDGYAHIWFDRPKRVLYREAEAIVRDNLLLFFKHKVFNSQHVARETQLPVGKVDLTILDRKSNKFACVLELKVLRSRGMPKNPAKGSFTLYKRKHMVLHAKQGVRQAEKYKEASEATLAYLCCFDGRDSNDILTEAKTIADEKGILYRQYYMEISTRDDLVTES